MGARNVRKPERMKKESADSARKNRMMRRKFARNATVQKKRIDTKMRAVKVMKTQVKSRPIMTPVGPVKCTEHKKKQNAGNATGRGRSKQRNAKTAMERTARTAKWHARMLKGNVGSVKTEFKWRTKFVQNAMVSIYRNNEFPAFIPN